MKVEEDDSGHRLEQTLSKNASIASEGGCCVMSDSMSSRQIMMHTQAPKVIKLLQFQGCNKTIQHTVCSSCILFGEVVA